MIYLLVLAALALLLAWQLGYNAGAWAAFRADLDLPGLPDATEEVA